MRIDSKSLVREPPDISELVYRAVRKIPEGRVSTYGDIAKALGDIGASRAVGKILANNPRPIEVPCHRVVYSDGKVGWYGGKGEGKETKVNLLIDEGVMIDEGRLKQFQEIRFRDFSIEPVLDTLREDQKRLAGKVECEEDHPIHSVAGLDVSYAGDTAFGARVTFDLESKEKIEESTHVKEIRFPYIPGYLSYRELPPLSDLVSDDQTLYMVDGQGILHPRDFGIASHLGVLFDVPSLGVAKSLLCGELSSDGEEAPIAMGGEVRGIRLKKGTKRGVYISVGHRISLGRGTRICKRFMKFKVPEPLRQAHILANKKRSEWEGGRK